jgi:hypothetical protein
MRDPTEWYAWAYRQSAAFAAALSCVLGAGRLLAAPGLEQNFNGPGTSWEVLDAQAPARILARQCVAGGARDEAGCERVVVAAPAGESVLLGCPTARVAVLEELEARLWVKSAMPAIQLAARIALPRSRDPESGAVLRVIVRGPIYTRPDHWQQLTLGGVPELLAAQLRIMRATPGASIDARQAYVECMVLVVPGEPRGVEVLTDELVVDGVRLPELKEIDLAHYAAVEPQRTAPGPPAGATRLQGGVLLVDERPFLPRVIQWQGESLEFLAARGFNAVGLPGPPDDEQIAEAQRHRLWFVCAAPRPETIVRDGLGRSGDRILAWQLDDEAVEADANYAVRWAELISERDAVVGRPVIVAPQSDWSKLSQVGDVAAARHPRVHQVSSAEYDRWLEGRWRFIRPGTPVWAILPTQFGRRAQQQAAELATTTLVPPGIEAQQVQSLVRVACTRGVRGFIFQSESPLSASDPATRMRAAALELLNRRLQLIDPWLAAGKVVGWIDSTDRAWSGFVLHVDRARLLIPVPATAEGGARPAADRSASGRTGLEFLVPGVPESSQTYGLSPVSLRILPAQRVAGGTRLVLPVGGDAMGLITEDPSVIQSLRQGIERHGPQFARLERDVVAQRAAWAADSARHLTQAGYRLSAGAAEGAGSIQDELRAIDAALAAGRLEEACEAVETANRTLGQLADALRGTVGGRAIFDSNPLDLSEAQLGDYAAFRRSSDGLRGGENLLYGGDFEDLGQMTQGGWRHFQQSLAGLDSHVELSGSAPKHGDYCLAMHVTSSEARGAPAIEWPPIWVVSPPMPVSEGQVIEITGWVRVDEPLGGDGGGLQIVDSLGGGELSLAARSTTGWQPFRMVRAVPEPTELRLTFALCGTGSAQVDAVMVRALQQPLARRLPPATSPQSR